jgi:hypothetical protein
MESFSSKELQSCALDLELIFLDCAVQQLGHFISRSISGISHQSERSLSIGSHTAFTSIQGMMSRQFSTRPD